jgi:peptide deformylase
MELISVDRIENIKLQKVDINEKPSVDLAYFIMDMIDFAKYKNGLGLSACQIGIFDKIFVAKLNNDFCAVINPSYKPIVNGKSQIYEEGCLSLPHELYLVKRYNQILANYYSFEGDRFIKMQKVFKLLDAVAFQHETDHCNGITIRMKGRPSK